MCAASSAAQVSIGCRIMEHPGFFARAGPFRLSDIVELTGAETEQDADPALQITDVGTAAEAGPDQISILDTPKFLERLLLLGERYC